MRIGRLDRLQMIAWIYHDTYGGLVTVQTSNTPINLSDDCKHKWAHIKLKA